MGVDDLNENMCFHFLGEDLTTSYSGARTTPSIWENTRKNHDQPKLNTANNSSCQMSFFGILKGPQKHMKSKSPYHQHKI